MGIFLGGLPFCGEEDGMMSSVTIRQMKPRSQLSVRTYGQAPGGHLHDHFQVIWPLQGCLELEVEGKGLALQVGDGLIVRPGDRHDFQSRDGSRCLVLDSSQAVWNYRNVRPSFAKSASQMAAFLAVALEENLPMAIEQGEHLLAQSWGASPVASKARRTVDWQALAAWTNARLDQPLRAGDLAGLVHLSESQFRARCLEEWGVTPMQWLRQLRLSKAQLLREAGLPVSVISARVGYETPSALTAAMAKHKRR
jgi:AraC-like DNA-binding protein/mannose-6-phosphate isomerase-like protein (cupin superfamily)